MRPWFDRWCSMGTFINFTNNCEAIAIGGLLPAPAPEARIAVIKGCLNYYMLGSIIALTKEHVSTVYLMLEKPDRRLSTLARSLGAEVIDTGKEGMSSVLNSILISRGPCTVVALNGDGSHDPGMIPSLIKRLNDGYDVVVGPSFSRVENESVRALNDKLYFGFKHEFVISSHKCIENFFARGNSDLGEQIVDHAVKTGLSIVYSGTNGTDAGPLGLYRICIVVPAYNEELLIGETLSSIPPFVERIYVIDDCSTDRTPDVLKTMVDPRLTTVRHDKNMGAGAAIITGYKLALKDGMDIVAVVDGDNQMDTAQLPRILMPIIEGKADYTKGNRLISKKFRKGMSRWRSFGNYLLSMITKIGSGYWQVMDPQNGYTAISRHALEVLDLDSIYTYYGYLNDLLIKLNAYGMRTVNVVIPARYGSEKSSIKYGKYIMKVAPMIFRGFLWRLKTKYIVLGFHPLVLFYAAAMVLVPAGLLLCAWVLARIALYGELSAALSLFAALITLEGLQFLFFAMVFDMQVDNSIRTA